MNLGVEATADAAALTLRPWGEPDLPAIFAAYQDPVMAQWLSTSLADESDTRAWLGRQIAGWAAGDRLSFAIVEQERPVGHVVVRRVDGTAADAGTVRTAEIGYWTLAEARGRGIASRTVETLTRWLFGPQTLLPADVVELIHAVGNEGSCRVALKCGYALEAVLPPRPPRFTGDAHLHVRRRPDATESGLDDAGSPLR